MKFIFLKITLLGLIVGLSACATRPFIGEKTADTEILTGRFAVSFMQAGNVRSGQGKFLWLQNAEQTRLEIFSILGQTQARIEIRDSGAILYLPGQQPRYANNADVLLKVALGFSVPLKALPDWLHGQAEHTSKADIQRDAQNHISSIRQSGWVIDYPAPIATPRPRRIDLSHADQGLQLRLIIDTP